MGEIWLMFFCAFLRGLGKALVWLIFLPTEPFTQGWWPMWFIIGIMFILLWFTIKDNYYEDDGW